MEFGEEDYWRNLFNQTEIAMTNNYNLFAEIAERPSIKYHPRLSLKGNVWVASYVNVGTDVIIGTGPSPQEAMDDFDKEFTSKIIPKVASPVPNSKVTKDNAEEIAAFKLNSSSAVTVATECIVINQDGNQFCALMGPNIQEGYAGFGDTPLHAILDLISYQADDSVLKGILNQKPDTEHLTFPKGG